MPTSEYLASTKDQTISYNGLNKVSQISQYDHIARCINKLNIEYGPDNQRIKSLLTDVFDDPSDHSITMVRKTKYFFGDFEIEIDNTTGQTRQLNYISGGSGLFAIIEIKNGITTPYYIHTDYLGNYNLITSGTGAKLEILSFDPWGRRRHPNNWSYTNVPTTFLFDRGYTGHEHLDKFGLINMNGRVFDPFLAKFLSPDPYLQNTGNSQANNRYSYCLNNPLKYIDPSGYKPLFDPCDPPPWNTWNPGFGPGGSTSSWRPANDAIFFCSSRSSFINTYGTEKYNQLYFSNITMPYLIANSELTLNGSKAENFYSYIQAGWSLYSVNAFNRTTYVLSLGDIGQMSRSNGGVKFSNPTAGEVLSEPNIIGQYAGSDDWINGVNNVITGLGVGSELFGGNYGLTSNQTIIYAERINGRVVSAAELTAVHTVQSLKVARALGRLNVVTGVLGTGYSTAKVFSDWNQGGWGNVNGLDVADAGIGAGGLLVSGLVTIGMISNPVGWVVGIGTGIYFGARLVYDLSK